MINNSEHQLSFIEQLPALADGQAEPREAVRSYHAALDRLKIRPYRTLDDDLKATLRAAAYGGKPRHRRETIHQIGRAAEPDFAKMTQAEKIAWNQARWKRILG